MVYHVKPLKRRHTPLDGLAGIFLDASECVGKQDSPVSFPASCFLFRPLSVETFLPDCSNICSCQSGSVIRLWRVVAWRPVDSDSLAYLSFVCLALRQQSQVHPPHWQS